MSVLCTSVDALEWRATSMSVTGSSSLLSASLVSSAMSQPFLSSPGKLLYYSTVHPVPINRSISQLYCVKTKAGPYVR